MTAKIVGLADLLKGGRAPGIVDSYGRAFTYLRISVTDLCNLRCVYCMPEEGLNWLPREEILSYEEITKVVHAAAICGVNKIRLTGGEPLVRKDIHTLVKMIAAVPGITDLALTTNGVLLAEHAERLAGAGLTRVNVSLDTMDPEKFKRIARRGELQNVLAGIDAAEKAGLQPLKVNMVVLRGLNDDEIEAFASLTLSRRLQVRFIEVMPLGEARDCTSAGAQFGFVSNDEVQDRIEWRFGRLQPLAIGQNMSDPAKVWRLPGAKGSLGFISAMSSVFCERCNRLRLTADGVLRACLLDGGEYDIRPILRSTSSDSNKRCRLIAAFQRSADMKPDEHSIWNNIAPAAMSRIGG